MTVEDDVLYLRRVKEKRARYISHENFLKDCLNKSYIPEGFRWNWSSTADMDEELRRKCAAVKKDACLKLVEITANACGRKADMLTMNIEVRENELNDYVAKLMTDEFEYKEMGRIEDIKLKKWRKLSTCKDQSFDVVRVMGDGNCFFRCISQYLFNTEERHSEVREEVITYMLKNKQKFEMFIDGSINKHLEQMTYTDGRISSWATEAELYGTSSKYELDISVTRRTGSHIKWLSYSWGMEGNNTSSNRYTKCVRLLFNHEHFNLLQPEAEPIILNGTSVGRENTDHAECKEEGCLCIDTGEEIDWFEVGFGRVNGYDECPKHSIDIQKAVVETEVLTGLSMGGCRSVNMQTDVSKERAVRWKQNKQVNVKYHRELKNKNSGKVITSSETVKQGPVVTDAKKPGGDIVTNLSNYKLSDSEISLLSKGLKFIPDRTKLDKVKLIADLKDWERRMRLKEFFYKDSDHAMNENITVEMIDRFKINKESRFTPNKGRDGCLDLYIELVKNDVVNGLKKAGKLNVSQEEHGAIYSLLNNNDIVIRPADKGSGIVVLNTSEYLSTLNKEMAESTSYTECHGNALEKSFKAVKKLVNKMYREGAITDDLKKYLIPKYPKMGVLKGNPKIHKKDAPFRSIVDGKNTPTEKLAEVAECELEEYVTSSPSFIRDTTDFIDKLRQIVAPLPDHTILFCFDVCKLYPSIPRKEGIDACREALENRTNMIVDTDHVLEMIKTVLDNNVFALKDKQFIQTDGIAIGSKLGRNFACSYMRKWDEHLLNYPQKPFFYKRFIDDGFGIWSGTVDSLKVFADFANEIHPNIKIELRYSTEKIEFLDTWVKLEKGHIYTDLYKKPTDKQLYIHNSSCHPSHTKQGLAYGLGLRIRRICEKEQDYTRHRKELKSQLRKRGYCGKQIERQLNRVDKLDRGELLKIKRKRNINDRVPLVLTYSKLLPDIRKSLRRHDGVLYSSEKMRKVFEKLPLLAFRRDSNVCDILVHNKTRQVQTPPKSECSCKICQVIWRGAVHDTLYEGTFRSVADAKCIDRNIVYALLYSTCDQTVYVGETGRQLKERMEEHRRDIRSQNDKPINRHFMGHTEGAMKVAVLERGHDDWLAYRLVVEDMWIERLRTKAPNGCNVQSNH